MFADIVKLILWLAITTSIGWSVLSFIFYRRPLLFLIERIAISYCLGLGLVSIEMALLSIFKIGFTWFSVLIWWVPVFLTSIFLDSKNKGIKFYKDIRSDGNLTFLEKFFIFGISLELFYAFFRALIKPIESFDSIAIHALKAKIFYMAKGIPQDFFTAFKDFVPHIEYPLLLPLSETYFYIFLGSLNDLLVKIIFPSYYLSILIMMYFILRRHLSRRISLFFTFLLATIPQFKDYATIGYADLPLAFYYSASFFYLYLWMREKERLFLALSFMLSALSLWTKAEGLMLMSLNSIVVIIYLLTEEKNLFKKEILYSLFSFTLIAIYLFIKDRLGLEAHSDFVKLKLSDLPAVILNFKRIPLILYEYQMQLFGPKKWNIIWIIFILGFSFNLKKAFIKDLRLVTLSIILIFFGYALIYMMLPSGDISWHLSTTASRFFIHFLPLIIVWLAFIFKEAQLNI